MSQESSLTDTYGADHIRVAKEGSRTLVRLDEVELYEGCVPRSTPLLVVRDPEQPKPLAYVGPGQRLANGKEPKTSSVVMVGGESWLKFSFNIPWEEPHGIGWGHRNPVQQHHAPFGRWAPVNRR